MMLNILILDDNIADAELQALELEEAGMVKEVRYATNKQEYIAALDAENKPQVILSDFRLPDMNGLEAKSILSEKNLNIPFILITGVLPENLMLSIVRSGVSDSLLKERIKDLPSAVHKALREHQEREARIETQNEHKDLLDNLKNAVLRVDSSGEIMFANKASESSIQLLPEEIRGKKFIDFVFEDDREYWLETLKMVDEGKNHRSAEIRIIGGKDGIPVWSSVTLSRSINHRNKNAGYIISYQVIEDWIRTKMELNQINDYLPGAVFRLRVYPNGKQVVDYFSKGIQRITGLPADIYQSDLKELLFKNVHPDDLPNLMTAVEKSLIDITPFQHEFRSKHLNNHYVYLNVSSEPRISEEGGLVCTGMITDVTETKELEIQLGDVINAVEVGIWRWNMVKEEVEINDILSRKLNYEGVKSLNAKDLFKLIHPDDIDSAKDSLRQIISQSKTDIKGEFRIKNKDGIWIWFQCQGKVVNETKDGTPAELAGMLTDISGIKEKEIFQTTLFEQSPMPKIIYCPEDFKILTANKSAVELYGYTQKELIEMNISDLFSSNKSNPDDFLEILKNGTQKGKEVLMQHQAKDGQILDVDFVATKLFLKNKECMMTVLRDVTESLKVKKDLKMLSLVAERATNGIVITDVDENIIWVNKGFENISGYSLSELMGNKPADMLQGKDTSDEAKEILRQGVKQAKETHVEIINYHKSGEPYWLEIYITPILNKKGELRGFIAVENDITKRKEAEIQLRNTLETLEETVNERTADLENARDVLELTNSQVMSSINYAKNIQLSVIPFQDEVQKLIPKSMLYFNPKDIVSGDFFWMKEARNKIYAAVVDCTGHGVPGALLSMVGTELLDRQVLHRQLRRPETILEELDFSMRELLNRRNANFNVNDGMDMSMVVIDLATNEIEYASAKSSGVMVSEGQLIRLKKDRMSIGGHEMNKDKRFTGHKIRAKKGDRFYFFTDGIVDQFGGEKSKKLRSAGFEKFLLEQQNVKMLNQTKKMESFFNQWKDANDQIDDVTVFGFEF